MTYRIEVEKVLQLNQVDLLYAVLGLVGEAGEVADLYKKGAFRGSGLIQEEKLIEELGDVRFYLEVACIALGIDMKEIEQQNIEKIRSQKRVKISDQDTH